MVGIVSILGVCFLVIAVYAFWLSAQLLKLKERGMQNRFEASMERIRMEKLEDEINKKLDEFDARLNMANIGKGRMR